MIQHPDVAYYYPAPYWGWREGGWIKSLLLFFDQVAILLPDYMYGRHEVADPSLAIPLEERGLLQILEPKTWVDGEMATELTDILVGLITSGAFDDLPAETNFAELSQSRMGYHVDIGLAEMVVEELCSRGLARPSEDGVSIPLHPIVRTTILMLLGQLSRSAGKRRGLTIHPATSDSRAINDLMATLRREPMPSAGAVVALDLEPVTLDFELVPLDDLLAFRAEYAAHHRAYMRDLHRFMAELAVVEESGDRNRLLLSRREELSDAAHDLQRSTRRAIGKNLASFSLGIAGGAWALATGDPIGIALAAAGLAPSFLLDSEVVTAYSYMFAVDRTFGTRT